MKNLIGRKVRGFKFENDYSELMDKHIGEIGVVNSVRGNKAIVVFKYDSWHYPIDQIKEHLVDEVPTKTYERWVTVKASELKELREFKESIKKLL